MTDTIELNRRIGFALGQIAEAMGFLEDASKSDARYFAVKALIRANDELRGATYVGAPITQGIMTTGSGINYLPGRRSNDFNPNFPEPARSILDTPLPDWGRYEQHPMREPKR